MTRSSPGDAARLAFAPSRPTHLAAPAGPRASRPTRREWVWPDEADERLASATGDPEMPIFAALGRLDEAGTGVLLLANSDRTLAGVLTDGDIRRHVLAGRSLELPCREIMSTDPVTAAAGIAPAEALRLMDAARDFIIHHLPLVDVENRIAGLLLRSDLSKVVRPELSAVIMAGGFGTRLRPLTDDVPKPMLPVGNRPLLELTIERLRQAGVRQVSLATHYLGDRIARHFGDGHDFGVDIHYVPEERPLGTAGALGLMERGESPILVLNGDVLTTVSFPQMLAFHREHRAVATIGVRLLELQVPYGVIHCDGAQVTTLHEKPVEHFMVNAGIYLLEPAALDYIPVGERFDMTDLIQRLLDEGRPVVSFPVVEYWLDIGQPADYARAQHDMEEESLA